MRGGNGVLLIVVGLIVLWLAISEKYTCVTQAFNCMVGDMTPSGTRAIVDSLPTTGTDLRSIFTQIPVNPTTPTTFPSNQFPRSMPELFQLPKFPRR